MSYYLYQLVISTFATLGFALFYNAPKSSLIANSILGGVIWTIYKFLLNTHHTLFLSGLVATFLLGVIGEILARILQNPVTIYIVPGLIPLVPGAGIYYTLYYLVYERYDLFKLNLVNSFFSSSSMAIGIFAALTFTKILKISKNNIKKKS